MIFEDEINAWKQISRDIKFMEKEYRDKVLRRHYYKWENKHGHRYPNLTDRWRAYARSIAIEHVHEWIKNMDKMSDHQRGLFYKILKNEPMNRAVEEVLLNE